MQAQGQFVTLRAGTEAKALIAPELGGWLLRYMRHLPEHGYVDALYFAQEIVDRYPNQMYAGNPLLFPQVSFSHLPGKEHHYNWQGQTYALPQHGFARRSKWRVLSVDESSVLMELSQSPATEAAYPFAFRTTVRYSLSAAGLRFEQTVENPGAKALPFSTGIHPYFPAPITARGVRNDCYVELPNARLITPNADWTSWTAQPLAKHRLPLSRDVSGTMFLTDLAEPRVALTDPASRLRIVLDFAEAPAHRYLAIWSKSVTDPFYCLEPWTALPNSLTRQDSELMLLKPGEIFRAAMTIRIEPL